MIGTPKCPRCYNDSVAEVSRWNWNREAHIGHCPVFNTSHRRADQLSKHPLLLNMSFTTKRAPSTPCLAPAAGASQVWLSRRYAPPRSRGSSCPGCHRPASHHPCLLVVCGLYACVVWCGVGGVRGAVVVWHGVVWRGVRVV